MNKIYESVTAMEEIIFSNNSIVMEKMWSHGKGELFILKYLCDKNAAVIPSEISNVTNTSTSRVSAVLGSLEKKKQIRRDIDTTNRRNILVTITEKGKERIHSDMQQMRRRITSIFTQMGEQKSVEFIRLLKLFFEITTLVFNNEDHER